MGFASSIQNAAEGVVGFFTGKNPGGYPFVQSMSTMVTGIDELFKYQKNWKLNPGYSFAVVDVNSPSTLYSFSGSDGLTSFQELQLNINPSDITVKEPMAVDIIPTQTGIVTQHSGSVLKDINISGTTGVHPNRGKGGVNDGKTEVGFQTITGGADTPAPFQSGTAILSGERPGWFHFHLLKNYLRAYVQIKADPDHSNAQLVFRNKKDGEDWFVEVTDFTMVRTSRSPILYNYSITMVGLKKVKANVLSDGNLLGAFGTFLDGVQEVENIINGVTGLIETGAGIITQFTDYISSIEQGFTSTILGPIEATTTFLDAWSNGVTTVSAMPKEFYTSLKTEVSALSRRMEDNAGIGNSSYNARYNRSATSTNTTRQEPTLQEIEILKGLNLIENGLSLMVATDLPFASSVSDPHVGPLSSTKIENLLYANTKTASDSRYASKAGIQKLFNNQLIIKEPNSAYYAKLNRRETLEEFSLRILGDVSRWYDIVILNNLKYPYVGTTTDKELGIVGYGESLLVPSNIDPSSTGVVRKSEDYITKGLNEIEKSMGIDLELTADNDLRLNSRQDLELLYGSSNAGQALHLSLLLEKGSLKYHAYKGVGLSPGKSDSSALPRILADIRYSITADPRFDSVTNLSVVRDGSSRFLDFRVGVSGVGKAIPLQFAL